jgi:hypothetical protein
MNKKTMIIIAVVAVLLIGVGVFLYMRSKKLKSTGIVATLPNGEDVFKTLSAQYVLTENGKNANLKIGDMVERFKQSALKKKDWMDKARENNYDNLNDEELALKTSLYWLLEKDKKIKKL